MIPIDPSSTMHWSSRAATILAKPAGLSRQTIAAAGLLSTVLLSQDDDERAKDDNLLPKSEEGKWSTEARMARLFPNYSFAKATGCDFSQPFQQIRRTNTRRKMREEVTDKKLSHLYKVAWDRPLGEGGFARVYLGKEKKSGGLGKIVTTTYFCSMSRSAVNFS